MNQTSKGATSSHDFHFLTFETSVLNPCVRKTLDLDLKKRVLWNIGKITGKELTLF